MDLQVPPGYRAYPPQLNIVGEILDRHLAAGRGEQPALIWADGAWTYAQLHQQVNRLAHVYRELGLKQGDVVFFRARNIPQACAAILAAYKTGAVATVVSTRLQSAELSAIIENADPALIVSHDELVEQVRPFVPAGGPRRLLVLQGAAAGNGELSLADVPDVVPAVPTVDTAALDPAHLFYSSGTTGKPKGVLHGHRWLAAMGDVVRLQMAYAPGDVVLTPGEYCFMATWGHCLIVPLYAGATIALYPEAPNPRKVLEAVAALNVTKFMAVPTFYRMVLAREDTEAGLDLSRVDAWMSGGEVIGEASCLQWEQRIGTPLYNMYGITEMQVLIGNGPGRPVRPGSLGQLFPGIQLSLRDDALNEVEAGQIGRAMVHRSDPGLFLEYYKNTEAWTRAHKGDYYDTGDLMRRDEDGYYWYVDRADDYFKSKGMFVSPSEVENVLMNHAAVAECAVVGLPDEKIGRKVAAYVVLRPSHQGTEHLEDELLALARSRLADYKVPAIVCRVEQLPKSALGKTLRRKLLPSAGS